MIAGSPEPTSTKWPIWAASPELRLRFEREAEAASKLDHPGIARVYDVGADDGLAYIAFELVQGKSLQSHISETTGLETSDRVVTELHFDFDRESGSNDETTNETPKSSSSAGRDAIMGAVRYTESAARALHGAHEAGLIHRNIKPGNLMGREDGTAC